MDCFETLSQSQMLDILLILNKNNIHYFLGKIHRYQISNVIFDIYMTDNFFLTKSSLMYHFYYLDASTVSCISCSPQPSYPNMSLNTNIG